VHNRQTLRDGLLFVLPGHLPLRRLNVHLHHSLQVRDRNGQVPKEYQVCGTPSQGGMTMVTMIDMGIPGYV
jgi:hypothetical protein